MWSVVVKMDYLFHPAAVQDAKKFHHGYVEISDRLGDRFWTELDGALDAVFANPEGQHFDASGFRRQNPKRFPYDILFEVRHDLVRIMVIRHYHRHPTYGMTRR